MHPPAHRWSPLQEDSLCWWNTRVVRRISTSLRISCEQESLLTAIFPLTGITLWKFRVPGTVFKLENLVEFKKFASTLCSSLVVNENTIPVTLDLAHWYSSLGLVITDPCRLALAASHFIVPPMPSHGPFPWLVAKKCHSALTWKSSSW